MGAIASQITSITIVYSAVYSDADHRKHQSSASLAFVRRIHRWPVNSPNQWPVTQKMFPFDDVIMKLAMFRRPKYITLWGSDIVLQLYIISTMVDIFCFSCRKFSHGWLQEKFVSLTWKIKINGRIRTVKGMLSYWSILRTVSQNSFFCLKISIFWFQPHWYLFPKFQWTITQHCFD